MNTDIDEKLAKFEERSSDEEATDEKKVEEERPPMFNNLVIIMQDGKQIVGRTDLTPKQLRKAKNEGKYVTLRGVGTVVDQLSVSPEGIQKITLIVGMPFKMGPLESMDVVPNSFISCTPENMGGAAFQNLQRSYKMLNDHAMDDIADRIIPPQQMNNASADMANAMRKLGVLPGGKA